jgi:hypothetical protein
MNWARALLLGDYQRVLANVECDAWIADAPFGDRTHAAKLLKARDGTPRRGIERYPPWTEQDVRECVRFGAPRTRGWFVAFSCHELGPVWADELAAAGRYVFPPQPVVDRGSNVRLQGDGPSSCTTWLTVARPRGFAWRTLPGEYRRRPGDPRSPQPGGKPLGVMMDIIGDYTRRGDLVVDPTAGMGTTLAAAHLMRRRPLGAERDRSTRADALEHIEWLCSLERRAASVRVRTNRRDRATHENH